MTVPPDAQPPAVPGALLDELMRQLTASALDRHRTGALVRDALAKVRVEDSTPEVGAVTVADGVTLAMALLEVLDEDLAATSARSRRVAELRTSLAQEHDRLDRQPGILGRLRRGRRR